MITDNEIDSIRSLSNRAISTIRVIKIINKELPEILLAPWPEMFTMLLNTLCGKDELSKLKTNLRLLAIEPLALTYQSLCEAYSKMTGNLPIKTMNEIEKMKSDAKDDIVLIRTAYISGIIIVLSLFEVIGKADLSTARGVLEREMA